MRGLTLKQLEAVTAIARHGSLTSAADALGVTPPAISARLKELEALAGLPLFDRGANGLRINDAGSRVLELADRVRSAIDLTAGVLGELRGVTLGTLVIGITSTAKYFAPRLIAAFARRYPDIDITLTVGNRIEIIDALRRMEVDIAIMGRPPAGLELVSEAFGDHPMIIVSPPDHPLVGRAGVTRAEVARQPFLLREEGSGTRTVFEEFFDGPVNRQTHFGIEISSNETIKQGVMAGLGLALISAHTVSFELETGRLAALDVEGLPILRKWFVARHADKAVLPAMKAFWDHVFAEGVRHLPIAHDKGS